MILLAANFVCQVKIKHWLAILLRCHQESFRTLQIAVCIHELPISPIYSGASNYNDSTSMCGAPKQLEIALARIKECIPTQ